MLQHEIPLMFTNPILISISGETIRYPNPDWTPDTDIRCALTLDLGPAGQVVWDESAGAPTLENIGTICRALEYSASGSTTRTATLQHGSRSINFHWNWCEQMLDLQIGIQPVGGPETIHLAPTFVHFCDTRKFRQAILSQLLPATARAVRNHYGELLFGYAEPEHGIPVFKIGDRVRTIPGDAAQTIRTGYVARRFFHDKDGAFMYQLLLEGKLHKSRYPQESLELEEAGNGG